MASDLLSASASTLAESGDEELLGPEFMPGDELTYEQVNLNNRATLIMHPRGYGAQYVFPAG